MEVGKKIKELRKQKKWSQEKLAAEAGISQSALSAIERGIKQPTVETLNNICNALNITLVDFFSKEKTELSPALLELINVASKMPENKLKLISDFIRGLSENDD